ncbi:MAG: hypothetical protein ACT4O1_11080 [Gemmatimonadota bacterium]
MDAIALSGASVRLVQREEPAVTGAQGPCLERNQAVIYRGPWKQVCDDDGHVLERGRRMAVCDKTFRLYQQAPYEADIFLAAAGGSAARAGWTRLRLLLSA